MFNLSTDDDELSVSIELDAEADEGIDLRDGLGDQLLDAAVAGMLRSSALAQAPDGEPWADLKPATFARKPGLTKYAPGTLTGDMLNPRRFTDAPRVIERRSATWFYLRGARGSQSWGKAHGFHNGRTGTQEPRPIFGWTRDAGVLAEQLLRDAQVAAAFAADRGAEVMAP